MKTTFALLILLICFTTCKKAEKLDTNSLIGKWKIEQQYDISFTGNQVWRNPDKPGFITFKKDGTFESDIYTSLKKYKIVDSKTLFFFVGDDYGFNMRYKLENSFLILEKDCLPGCGDKYSKISN